MELKEIYKIAKDHFSKIINNDNPDFRLEQVEYNEDEKTWDVVVSYLMENPNKVENPLNAFTQTLPYERVYKRVKINKNKKVIGFYIFNN